MQHMRAGRARERDPINGRSVAPTLPAELSRLWRVQFHRIRRQGHPHQRPIKPFIPKNKIRSSGIDFSFMNEIAENSGRSCILGSYFEDIVVTEVGLD